MKYLSRNWLKTLAPALIVFSTLSEASGFADYQPIPAYEETTEASSYVTMRDGVKLAISVVRPAKNGKAVDGKFPVIWHHTLSISREARDGTGGFISALHAIPTLAKHGYVVVQVARRGNGQSFGVMRGYHDRNEAFDAYEMTQWLAEQPWSDGNVGVYGCSNTGDAAMHAMSLQPPALKAVFAGCFSWHKFDAFRRGAIFAQWGTGPARTIEDDMAIPPVDADEDKKLLRQAAHEHQLATPLLQMWSELPFRDSWSKTVGSRFWSEGSVADYKDQVARSGIPLYIMGGWFDELRDQGLITLLNVPGSRAIVGPWQHCRNDDFPLLDEIHRFFDTHLKGLETGLNQEPPLHYFVMEGSAKGHWASSSTWPVEGVDFKAFAMTDSGLKTDGQAEGTLDQQFDVKFEQNCPGEKISSRSQPCSTHEEGIHISSEPLVHAIEVTGHPKVTVNLSTNRNDANLFAYLEDVAPDGSVTVITEGRLKASMRKTDSAPWLMPEGTPWHRWYKEDQQLLTAYEPVELTFAMMPTSRVFAEGHKIRVTFTGSDYRERLRDDAGHAQTIRLTSPSSGTAVLMLPVAGN
ncbi:CocE/NonD family hydrolase [Alteromonas sp. NFXS44]|uniref:CocE/NonD family hydrolase n=1 Tax=Alteromonas sp. NFXS44 TaxID=2818435 RepID=UPI0032DEE3F4